MIKTTPEYWDCACDVEDWSYIHPKSEKKCTKCGAIEEDCPDSRVNEVRLMKKNMATPVTKFKYSLYRELLDQNNVLSHVFFNCANDFIAEIASKNKGKTHEQIEKRKIEIDLKIDGHICDPKKFFNVLFEQYSEQVRRDATKIVKEQTGDKLKTLVDKLSECDNMVDELVKSIDWDTDLKK